jgi:hypothetical protein
MIRHFASTAISQPSGVAAAPDCNLWFVESYGDKIGRITPSINGGSRRCDRLANWLIGLRWSTTGVAKVGLKQAASRSLSPPPEWAVGQG